MGAVSRWILMVAGLLTVSAVLTSSCASPRALVVPNPPADAEKWKVQVKIDHKYVDPFLDIKVGGATLGPDDEFPACTQPDIDAGKCKRLGYPLEKDKSKERYGNLSREPILILTDVASPGTTCVCYKNQCYCR